MPYGIGFDLYSTLVDPLAMSEPLESVVGDVAEQVAAQWRQKQLEYSFRRALMGTYADFDVCAEDALIYATRSVGVELGESARSELLAGLRELAVYPDVAPGLQALRAQGHMVVVCSNGVESTLREVLMTAGVWPHLDGVVSADDLRTFKPDPRIYAYLARRLERELEDTWLVSGSPRDVIGAKSAGLRAAWIKRDPAAVYDPWGDEPDIVVSDVMELAEALRA